MDLYLYAENTCHKATVYTGDEPEECGDVFLWGTGTSEQLIQQARERLAVRYDQRPGGAADSFDWRCARSVLVYLGAKAI